MTAPVAVRFLHNNRPAKPDPSNSHVAGSGTLGICVVVGPNVKKFGPCSPPLPLVTKALTNAPVVPLYSNTLLQPGAPVRGEQLTKRSPFGPNARPNGCIRPPPLAKVLTNAPVVPLYSNTLLVYRLLTKRFPFGPKVKSQGLSRWTVINSTPVI